MSQGVAALAAGHLVSHAGAALLRLRLQLLGQAVRVNWVLKCGPGCVMFILLSAKYCSDLVALKEEYFQSTSRIRGTRTYCTHTFQD